MITLLDAGKWCFIASASLLGVYVAKVGPFPLYDWLGLCSASLIMIHVFMGGRIRKPDSGMIGAGTLVVVGGLITAMELHRPDRGVVAALEFGYLLAVWNNIGRVVIGTRRDLRMLFAALTLSMAATSIAALVQLVWGVRIPGTHVLFGRMSGLTRHPNELGTFCAMVLPLAISLVWKPAHRRRKSVFWTVCAVVGVGGLVLSASLTGLVATIVGIGIYGMLSPRVVRRFLYGWVFAVGTIATVAVFISANHGAQAYNQRIERLADKGVGHSTLATRVEGDAEAWQLIKQRPMVGYGLTAKVSDVGTEVHNSFLAAWYGGGVLVLIGLCMALGGASLAFRRAQRTVRLGGDWQGRNILAAVGGSLGAFAVTLTVSPVLYQRSAWFPVVAVLIILSLARYHTAKITRTDPAPLR